MAVSPINVTRISQGLRTDMVLQSLRRNQVDLFQSQARIASGRRFVSPSEDPVSSARAVDLTQALARQNRIRDNLQFGDNALSAADSAIGEITSLLIDASSIASQNVSNLTSAAERASEAELVAGIRQQLQVVGNRQLGGRFIFAGRNTTQRPFEDALGGIAFMGDTGDRFTRVGDGITDAVNVTGNILFNALSDPIATSVDLTPVLTEGVRLEDVTGAAGRTIQSGTLLIREEGAAAPFSVDLGDADTVGTVVERINSAAAEAGAQLTASLADEGLVITPGTAAVSISDTGAGAVASALGIRTLESTTNAIVGQKLVPRVTRLTPIDSLAGGSGIDIEGGLLITNGEKTVTVDLSGAETVQDVMNAINSAGVFVLARINSDGSGIDVLNRVSGTALRIGENGGTTAADLGIRTFDTATPLDRLNFGRGITTAADKDDLRVTAKDGSTVDVNLDGALTVGDVIELINAAATQTGVSITASFAETGNGIRILDDTAGTGSLSVGGLNLSAAAADLGLETTVTGDVTEITGGDVNPTRTEGILDALVDLENALRRDDTQGISLAGERLDVLRNDVTRIQGVVGARAQAMNSKRQQMEDAAITTEIFLSEVRDIDYAEAITKLQAATTQLQANLSTSSTLLNLSLMDFLR